MSPLSSEADSSRDHGRSILRESIEVVGLAVILAFVLRIYVLQAFYIPSKSMENTLLPDDRLLVNKLAYNFSDVKHGEIIVFHGPVSQPWAEPKDYVKRVMGIPGDRLSLKDGHLVRNGIPLDEAYLKEPMDRDRILHPHLRWDRGTEELVRLDGADELVVPDDHLFMMGDNRNNSQDSRSWGFVDKNDIIGRALFIYWPFSRMGFVK